MKRKVDFKMKTIQKNKHGKRNKEVNKGCTIQKTKIKLVDGTLEKKNNLKIKAFAQFCSYQIKKQFRQNARRKKNLR